MRDSLKRIVDDYNQNREVIGDCFKWEYSVVHPLCAYIFGASDKMADAETIQKSKEIVKKNAGAFSSFRGSAYAPTSCLVALSSDPEAEIQNAVATNELLKKAFGWSEYMSLMAMMIKKLEGSNDLDKLIADGKEIYEAIRAKHKLVTGGEDAVMSILLALKGQPVEDIVNESEEIMTELKEYGTTGSRQVAALVLTLSDKPVAEKCRRFKALFEGIRERGKKYRKDESIALLASLAVTDVDVNTLLDDICAVDDELADKKGYKGFTASYDRPMRAMHAAMLVSLDYTPTGSDDEAAVSNITALFLVHQIIVFSIEMSIAMANVAFII
ncbi:MAG: DUF4003 family protein [Ruminococcus sp.]|nr:DUF4003 family protein [Ruminococcus sp.]